MAVRTTAAERVFARLREEILTGRLAPGTQHSIYRLAEELGVSRTPVREAVLRLADAGLVTVERNRGVRVRGVTVQDVLEVFELRLLLEVPAAAFAARRADAAHRERIEDCLRGMTDAAAAGDVSAFDEHDRALHAALHAVSGNVRLGEEVLSLRASIQARGAVTLHRSRGAEEILEEHVPIVRAVLDGDSDRAAALMRDHLVHTAELLVRQLDPTADVGEWRSRTAAFDVSSMLLSRTSSTPQDPS
jgi:DNA-binding GntR family transcriptional regulator